MDVNESNRAGRRNIIIHRLLVFMLAIGMLSNISFAAALPEREWTVMVYMNAKNNLEKDALDNFYSIATVGSTADVAVVAELGRPALHYTLDEEGWSGVYRFHVTKNSRPVPGRGTVDVAAMKQTVDMGSPEALRDFIRWAKKERPAKRYMLVIWNHGQGWRLQRSARPELRKAASDGRATNPQMIKEVVQTPVMGGFRSVSSDDDTGSVLYNSQIQAVVTAEFTSKKLDLLGFDACLMSMIETAYAFTGNTEVMVGSQELEPATGWNYKTWLERLVRNPRMSAEQLGREVVDAYETRYGMSEYLTTQSAIRLSGVSAATAALSRFADNVKAAGASGIDPLRKARMSLTAYGASLNPPLATSVDLITLLRRFEANTQNESLRDESALVRGLMETLVIRNYASRRSADPRRQRSPYGSEGLAVYFPASRNSYISDHDGEGYKKENTKHIVAFVRDTTWADLLFKILEL